MAAITTTGTLTAGNSRTFALAPGSALTLTLLPNCRVTVTETPETVSASDAGGNSPRTHSHQLAGVVTYGPYAMGGSVVVANASNSGSTVTWGRKDSVVSTDSTGTSLVSGDGNRLSIEVPGRDQSIPYSGMQGPTQLIGSALTGTSAFSHMESFWEAIRRKSCKVCFLGDSVTENISQNWSMGHWTVEFERELMRAFPDVAFEFINISIGGKIALQVLGRAAGDAAPTSALGSSYTAGSSETASTYARDAASGATVPTNPETWQGSASGVAQYANGQVWMSRIAPHNADLMVLTFGLNEENTTSVGKWWFAASIRAIIENVRSHSTFDGYTRPSIICGTPYNDTINRPLRNQLAEQMFAVSQQYNCPIIDANRWDGIAVEGRDRLRQRWYGEMGLRYLVNSKNDNTLSVDRNDYWDITGTLSTGAGGAATDYLSGGGSPFKILRKYVSRDVQLCGAFNSSSSGAVNDDTMSLWYRVDPTNTALGYEVKYTGSGSLQLIWHDSTGDVVVASKSIYALTSNTEPTTIFVRCVGARHEIWTAFGASPPATGYDPKSMQLQLSVIHSGAEAAAPLTSDIFKEGWSGFSSGGGATVPALRVGNYSTQTTHMQFGTALVVNNNARATEFDLNGTTNNHPNYQPDTGIVYDGDNRGGNAINHLATDAYSLVYGAAIGSMMMQLVGSRVDSRVLGSSGVAVTAPADTADNVLATIPLPAGLMGKNGELRVSALFSHTGSTNSKTVYVRVGPSFGAASTIGSLSTSTAANVAMVVDVAVKNRGNPKQQIRLTAPLIGSSQTAASNIAVDTTVANNVYISAQKALAGESVVLERYSVMLVGG